MDDLGKVNIGIVNALIKLTKVGLINWTPEIFNTSSPKCWVPEGSIVTVHSTTVQDRLVSLSVTNDIPKHLNMEGVSILNSIDHVNELTIPPLVALHRAISGSAGNIEVRTREDFLTDINKLCVA